MVLQWVAESYGRLHHRNITRGNYIPYTRIHADRVPNAKIDDLDPAHLQVPLTSSPRPHLSQPTSNSQDVNTRRQDCLSRLTLQRADRELLSFKGRHGRRGHLRRARGRDRERLERGLPGARHGQAEGRVRCPLCVVFPGAPHSLCAWCVVCMQDGASATAEERRTRAVQRSDR